MKIIHSILVLSLCGILAGCGNCDIYTPNNPIKVIKADYDFTSVGGDGIIELEPTGRAFQALSDVAWLKPVVKGNNIVFNVPAYTGITQRTAIIKISSDGRLTTCAVLQQGALFFVDKDEVNFSKEGGKGSVKLKATLPYEVTKSDTWFDYTITGDNIEITTQAATSQLPRSGNLTLSANREGSSQPQNNRYKCYSGGSLICFWRPY